MKQDTPSKLDDNKDGISSLTKNESSGRYEEKKYDGYHHDHLTNTNTTYKFPFLVHE